MAADLPKTLGSCPRDEEGEPPWARGGPQGWGPQGRGLPRRPPGRTRLRNRRFAALRELLKGGDYFSEEQMRLRAPGLFHHYIGRFRDPKIHPGDPKNGLGDPK
ncbi:CCD97 protein, partial [Erpornis zantholeuca]|nr:CCD97 protein [Erpornis zantholeuca]